MFWIKLNIVDQTRHKEEKNQSRVRAFLKSHFLNTCGTKLWELWRKSYIFSVKWTSITGWCENLLPGAWKLQFPLVLAGTKCLMSHVFCLFTVSIYLVWIFHVCTVIKTTHHDMWHLTKQFSLTLLKLLLC